jgi:hypothetical protein
LAAINQIKLHSGNACYHSHQNISSSHLLSKNVKIIIIILPVVLYGCETSSLKMGAFENRMLLGISEPEGEKIARGWRKLHK